MSTGGAGVGGAREEAVEDGVDGRVAKGEGLAGWGEDDDGDVGTAEDGELTGFLEEASPALGEAHLPGFFVLDALYLDLLPAHAWLSPSHFFFFKENFSGVREYVFRK